MCSIFEQVPWAAEDVCSVSVIRFFLILILFICAYNVWVISPPHPTASLTPPYPSLSGRNYSSLISNFVYKRV
jgi:hypothetical protein